MFYGCCTVIGADMGGSVLWRLPWPCAAGIMMVLENWNRLPKALFAKAWVKTGHVSKEVMMQKAGITEEQWQSCSILEDPAQFFDVLGVENSSEPALQELIQNGARKRFRVVWLVSTLRPDFQEMAVLPGCLTFPVEKRLSNYLFATAQGVACKSKSTIILSKRSSKEISPDMVKKHTVMHANGTRTMKEDAPARTLKDRHSCVA